MSASGLRLGFPTDRVGVWLAALNNIFGEHVPGRARPLFLSFPLPLQIDVKEMPRRQSRRRPR